MRRCGLVLFVSIPSQEGINDPLLPRESESPSVPVF